MDPADSEAVLLLLQCRPEPPLRSFRLLLQRFLVSDPQPLTDPSIRAKCAFVLNLLSGRAEGHWQELDTRCTRTRVERRHPSFFASVRGPHRLQVPSSSAFWPQTVVGTTPRYGECKLRGWGRSLRTNWQRAARPRDIDLPHKGPDNQETEEEVRI